MAKKHEYIEKNMPVLRKLVNTGDISTRMITDYKIYQVFKGYKNVKSKMDRYHFVADDLGTSKQVVMRAVKSMESQI